MGLPIAVAIIVIGALLVALLLLVGGKEQEASQRAQKIARFLEHNKDTLDEASVLKLEKALKGFQKRLESRDLSAMSADACSKRELLDAAERLFEVYADIYRKHIHQDATDEEVLTALDQPVAGRRRFSPGDMAYAPKLGAQVEVESVNEDGTYTVKTVTETYHRLHEHELDPVQD